MGFSYAQIHVRRERCKLAVQEHEKKAEAMGGGEEEGDKRRTADDDTSKASGGSWASVRGKTAPRAFLHREDLLTQVEKTPEPLPHPYTVVPWPVRTANDLGRDLEDVWFLAFNCQAPQSKSNRLKAAKPATSHHQLPVKMTSMGFTYAQINVQQERCKLAAQAKEKKTMEATGDKGEDGNKRPAVDNSKDSWSTGWVHPCAGTLAALPPNVAE
ncbi:hypothetical protein EJB05_22457, partial [Eragrostis curvula]